jgi:hypothetical protein
MCGSGGKEKGQIFRCYRPGVDSYSIRQTSGNQWMQCCESQIGYRFFRKEETVPCAGVSPTAGLACCGSGPEALSGDTPWWQAPQSHADAAPRRCAVLARYTERRTRTAHLYNTRGTSVTGRRASREQWSEHFISTHTNGTWQSS